MYVHTTSYQRCWHNAFNYGLLGDDNSDLMHSQ